MDRLPDQAGVFGAALKSGASGIRRTPPAAGAERRLLSTLPMMNAGAPRAHREKTRHDLDRAEHRSSCWLLHMAPCKLPRPPSRRLVSVVVPLSLALHHAREQHDDTSVIESPL